MGTFLSCLALPWLSPSLACAALSSSSNCPRSLFASTYERPPKRSPRTGKPSAAPKPPKRDSEPNARPETPLCQIASDRLPSSQIAVSPSPAHLTPLIKPFLPVVPQKQGVSLSRYPKGPEGHYHPFSPKKREEGGATPPTLPLKPFSWFPGWAGVLELPSPDPPIYPGLDRPGGGEGGDPIPPVFASLRRCNPIPSIRGRIAGEGRRQPHENCREKAARELQREGKPPFSVELAKET